MITERTECARRAESLAQTFEAAVRRIFSAYTIDLTTPGPSTRGGERALQHIRLVTSDGRTFILGSTNIAEGRAELRTLGYTLAMSKRRFGRELRLPPREYMRFLEVATKVLEELGVRVAVVAYGKDREEAAPPAPKRRAATLPYYALTAGSVAALAAMGWMVMQ